MATNPLTVTREDPPSPIEVLLENRRLREHQKQTLENRLEGLKKDIERTNLDLGLLDTAIEQLNEAINFLGGFAPVPDSGPADIPSPAHLGSAQPARRPIRDEPQA